MRARWSGLDGLRAVAVSAVLMFHFAPGLLPGGFLGVDVFFVISGYLITRLLVDEVVAAGGIDARRFYVHRARRLLPSLAGLLVAVCAASLIWRDELATVRSAVLAAVAYVSNWWQAESHQPYFVTSGRPSMLQHLWSLGIEEQFYLLWPLIVGFVLAHGSARRLAVVAVLMAGASTALMIVLANLRDVPFHDDGTRLYYGTDTHSAGLLVGAAAGALASTRLRQASWRSEVIGVIGLGLLVRMLWSVDEYSRALYRGGFLLAAVLAVAVVATVTRPGSRLGGLLDCRALRAVGRRSYSIYLWHWPVAVVTRPGLDVHLPAVAVFAIRLAATAALAEMSYRWLEQPVRTLGFRAVARAAAERVRRSRAVYGRARWVAGAASFVLIAAALVLVGAPRPPESQAAQAIGGRGGRSLTLGTRPVPPAAHLPEFATSRPISPFDGFGDSVMLGARKQLAKAFPGGTLDAVEGRQAAPVLADVRTRAVRGTLGRLVVIQVGDNGLIDPADLRRTLAALHDVARVLVLTVRVDRPWENPVNATIRSIVPRYHNAQVVDWRRECSDHPSWFYEDGLHLDRAGARAYARMIEQAGATERGGHMFR